MSVWQNFHCSSKWRLLCATWFKIASAPSSNEEGKEGQSTKGYNELSPFACGLAPTLGRCTSETYCTLEGYVHPSVRVVEPAVRVKLCPTSVPKSLNNSSSTDAFALSMAGFCVESNR